MPLTSSVMRHSISNFRLNCCSKKIQILRKKVKLLLEQLEVCIFAKIVFGVRCTLNVCRQADTFNETRVQGNKTVRPNKKPCNVYLILKRLQTSDTFYAKHPCQQINPQTHTTNSMCSQN